MSWDGCCGGSSPPVLQPDFLFFTMVTSAKYGNMPAYMHFFNNWKAAF